MKIIYILGSLNRGGMESLLLDMARQHQAAPYEMVFVHRKEGSYRDAFYSSGVEIKYLPLKKWRLLSYLISLSKFLAYHRVDIVHTQMAIDCIYAKYALRIGKVMGFIQSPIQVITTFHGFDMGEKGFNHLRRKWAIRMADKVCFVSQYEKDDYERRYDVGNKGYVIYNGIDFSKISTGVSENGNSTKHTSINMCMVGSFGSGRSHIVVCKALKVLRDRETSIEFYFAGAKRASEAALYDNCYEFCQQNGLKNVHFIGNCDDVYGLLQKMDGFVYSTVHDTFGIAVIEALAAELPVIVNDWAVMKEVTHNGEYATLFKSNDPVDCANKIQNFIEHLMERKEQAKMIAEKVREEYSIEKHIARLNEIYNEI